MNLYSFVNSFGNGGATKKNKQQPSILNTIVLQFQKIKDLFLQYIIKPITPLTNPLTFPSAVFSLFTTIYGAFKTLENYCDKEIRQKTWRHISVFFSVQFLVTACNYLSTILVNNLYTALKKRDVTLFMITIKHITLINLAQALLVAVLGWFRRYIQSNWLKGFRENVINKIFNAEKRQFIHQQHVPLVSEVITNNTSQIIVQDFNAEVYTTLVAASQFLATLGDIISNAWILYCLSPQLLLVALVGLGFSLLSFSVWEKMGTYYDQCKRARNNIQMDIDEALQSYRSLSTNSDLLEKTKTRINELITEMNSVYQQKIFWDRIGNSITSFMRAIFLPLSCISLSPSYFSGLITFGQFQVGYFSLKNLFDSLTTITKDIDMYANYQTTHLRCMSLLNILEKDSLYPKPQQPENDHVLLHIKEFQLTKPGNEKLIYINELQVKPGERVIITGENGSGKSQVFNALAGTIAPSSSNKDLSYTGTCQIEPNNFFILQQQEGESEITPLENKSPTHREIIEVGLKKEITEYELDHQSRYPTIPSVKEIAKNLGLNLDEKVQVNASSGGETSKYKFIRLIINILYKDTKIIICDEAFSSMSPEAMEYCYRLLDHILMKLKHPPAVIEVSHDKDMLTHSFYQDKRISRHLIVQNKELIPDPNWQQQGDLYSFE
ncbi:MAG TPA: ATP-binding cassette domain-containing protein [Gammaproteobacteria bacterium]|nr:ATP-binding cassette domain-containing protein [Gammaproteobacteria bacterium]